MAASDIVIKGAREHNLRDVNLVLPRNQLICFTGVSGSGKSSLAFDTLYAEGQRRYVESLSSFARQFLGQMPKPEVDLISGLSPSISISQKTAGQNPRSTVGTITEIADYLRVLYARVGKGNCSQCGRPITAQTRQQILQRIAELPGGRQFLILAPLVRGQKGQYRDLFDDLLKQGFARARVDGAVVRLGDQLNLDRRMRHDIEVVVDRLTVDPATKSRMAEAVELALKVGDGNLIVAPDEDHREATAGNSPGGKAGGGADLRLSAQYACTSCSISFEPPSPQMFSFNSPRGMCSDCAGLGEIYTFDPQRLIPNPGKSFQQGCVELLGPWRQMGRWRRHIYRGVAQALEKKHGLEEGTALETAWEELHPAVRDTLLWGAGDEHITFTWRSGPSGHKWGGKYEGIIPKLLLSYKTSGNRMQRRALERYMDVIPCETCEGERLNPQARAVTLTTRSPGFDGAAELSLPGLSALAVSRAEEFLREVELDATSQVIASEALKEIRGRLRFLSDVGLDYLTLARTAPTLSGGEMQRIRLAGQIGCGLVGVLYILDEPSIGLHARDNQRLLETMARLRDQGNTVIVVEHDEDTMRAADHVVDFGPGPGVRGGLVVADGPVEQLLAQPKSVTGQYLAGTRRIEIPKTRRCPSHKRLTIRGARQNNLKGIDVEIPLGTFVCVTGVSGSGKSSLVNNILIETLRRDLNAGQGVPGAHDSIQGLEHLDKMIAIDQSPIGRTPRSNPATYVKVLDEIRRLYTQLPESKARGYKPGRFSFNVAAGRCEACDGNGSTKLEMDFLADVWVTCPVCQGHRFNRETLQVRFKGKSIAQVLEMDIQQALEHFDNVPKIRHRLQTLHDVGLDYMKLGQPSPTLSGGEAQRVKLARELAKKSTGKTLYVLDEPTTGLHFADIDMLLKVLHDFVDGGNTVLVVEHNLEVIKTADWIIDLGPEGGEAGGEIVAAGVPEDIVQVDASHTGKSLRRVLFPDANGRKRQTKAAGGPTKRRRPVAQTKSIKIRGASQHNLKSVDTDIPRDCFTVFCGPSGSGKSSLAMDTIYAEGQRRYVESLSAYARQFVGQMQKPKLEHIEGLSPAIAIEQKHSGNTPRSTVGTVTEIYDYLRILFARLGEPYCPDCDVPIGTQSADEIIGKIMAHPGGTRLYLLAPMEVHVGERYETLWEEMRGSGYVRVRIDGEIHGIDDVPNMDRRRRHVVEVVVDRLAVRHDARSRVAGSVEDALTLGRGVVHVLHPDPDMAEADWPLDVHSQHFACDQCGRSFDPLTPHSFSFNSSLGWCPACEGLGVQTGANPAGMLRDPQLSLAQGAVGLWPEVGGNLFGLMLDALAGGTGIPLDIPFDELGAKHRRLVMHGTGDRWFDVRSKQASGKSGKGDPPLFRFQYKGLYPSAEEAGRTSPSLRTKLEHLVDEVECTVCNGSRLHDAAAAVQLRGRTLDEVCRAPLGRLLREFDCWKPDAVEKEIAAELIRETRNRLGFLVEVGLEYLTLGRPAPSLSGGEAQRIRLAAQVGSGLCGVLYVLDEPTIGLHPRDNRRLLGALRKLRDLGNTLLVVEHDREVLGSADRLLDFGPAAGSGGGEIVAQGTPKQLSASRQSVTGPYLSGKKAIAVPTNRRMASRPDTPADLGREKPKKAAKKAVKKAAEKAGRKSSAASTDIPPVIGWLSIRGARHNNLKNIDVEIPLGTFTAVTGPSGSGKSSLVEDVLFQSLSRMLHRAKAFPGAHDAILGVELINKVIRVDQQSLGQTPTSNPATYTGVFDSIRTLYSQLPEAKLRGFSPRRFSFNVAGGRCEKCEGNGKLRIEMHFLPDVWVECDVCRGRRYEPETLGVRFHGQSIADVLDMSCSAAAKLFANVPKIRRTLRTLCDVGLDYVTLGQPAPTLSGGEAQRVKLAAELSRPDTGRTLYLLDEPTTGLHFDDLRKLLDVLNRLVDLGNTVVVIEHNLDVIKTADWVIDIGPEAGADGGQVVVAGTPEDVVQHARRERHAGKSRRAKLLRSHSGEALDAVLSAGPFVKRELYDFAAEQEQLPDDLDIQQIGGQAKMPWQVDGPRWHTKDRTGRDGGPCRWDGRILAEIVDRIEERDQFSPTDWNSRSVVEIRDEKKSHGWFFHAITGEQWLLKLKFRVAKGAFRREDLVERLDLKPLNDMPDLPLYGTAPRVKCKNLRGPWQEIELRVHTYKEIDRAEFWEFLDRAIDGFRTFADRVMKNPKDLTPWKVLGRKWHFTRRGFAASAKVQWEYDVLESLMELLGQVAPQSKTLWNNKQVVPIYVSSQHEPWAAVQTKKAEGVRLTLTGPKGHFTLGRVRHLGHQPELDAQRPPLDLIRLNFRSLQDLARGDLGTFLREHLATLEDKS